ncbi:MAG: O-antigen ligase family protein [Pseudomonadota bacterium]
MFFFKNASLLTNYIICLFFIVFFIFNNLNIPLVLISLLFIWVKLNIGGKDPDNINHLPRINIYIFLFLLSLLISAFFSSNSSASIRVILHVIPGVMLYLLIAEKFDINKINCLFHTFTTITIIISIILLFNYWSYPLKNVRELVKVSNFLFMFTPNDTVILSFFSFFSFYILTTTTDKKIQLFSLIGILLALTTVVIYQSRLAILINILFALLYLYSIQGLKQSNKKHIFIVLILVPLIILVIDMFNQFTLLNKLTNLTTLQHRYHLWLAAWDIFLQHPLLGSGSGSYIFLYQNILDSYGFIEFKNQRTPWPHGVFIELLAEQGIIGYSLFVLIIIQNFMHIFQLNSVVHSQHPACQLNKFLIFINICYLFCLVFELTLHRTWVSFFLFTLLGISQLTLYKNKKNI